MAAVVISNVRSNIRPSPTIAALAAEAATARAAEAVLTANLAALTLSVAVGGGGGGTPSVLVVLKASNLSDLADIVAARTNLGLAIGTDIPSLAALTAEAITARAAEALKLVIASNLSDLTNVASARANLGLAIGINIPSLADLDDEAAAARAAEAALAAAIATLDPALVDAVAADLAAEIITARAAEVVLTDAFTSVDDRITNEATAARASEAAIRSDLSDDIAAEAAVARAAEATKLSIIANLSDVPDTAAARTNLDLVIGTNIPSLTALTNEATTARAAEAALTAAIAAAGSVFADSIVDDGTTVTLDGDEATPSAFKVYGTDDSGARGWVYIDSSNYFNASFDDLSVIYGIGSSGTTMAAAPADLFLTRYMRLSAASDATLYVNDNHFFIYNGVTDSTLTLSTPGVNQRNFFIVNNRSAAGNVIVSGATGNINGDPDYTVAPGQQIEFTFFGAGYQQWYAG